MEDLRIRVGQVWKTYEGSNILITNIIDSDIGTYPVKGVDLATNDNVDTNVENLEELNMYVINGKLVDRGIKIDKIHRDAGAIILNGEEVLVGDTWLTREGERVTITKIDASLYAQWPIEAVNNLGHTMSYTINGIYSSNFDVGYNDIVYKVEEFVDNIEEEVPTLLLDEETKTNEELPTLCLDEVYEETKTNEEVPTLYLDEVDEETKTNKELVCIVGKTIKPEPAVFHKEDADVIEKQRIIDEGDPFNELPSTFDSELTEQDILDSEVEEVKNLHNRLVEIIGTKINRAVIARDINAVKYLTKVLTKIIELEKM